MVDKNFQVKQATIKDLEIITDWAAQEGWNPGLNDSKAFFKTDPYGYFIGYLNNKPISSISAVAYDDNFGFLGFYITSPEYRKQGYGRATWNRALEHLPTQNIGLDGVVTQQENYKKSGFKLAYRNIRYKGKSKQFNQFDSEDVSKIQPSDIKKIIQYDQEMFPVERSKFLNDWLNMSESYSFKAINEGSVVGYSTIRRCVSGYKIGPLFADNFDIAEKLFRIMNSSVPENSPLYLDTPEPNKNALRLAQQNDMQRVFETARMYTKDEPQINLDKVFGVTSFELG